MGRAALEDPVVFIDVVERCCFAWGSGRGALLDCILCEKRLYEPAAKSRSHKLLKYRSRIQGIYTDGAAYEAGLELLRFGSYGVVNREYVCYCVRRDKMHNDF